MPEIYSSPYLFPDDFPLLLEFAAELVVVPLSLMVGET